MKKILQCPNFQWQLNLYGYMTWHRIGKTLTVRTFCIIAFKCLIPSLIIEYTANTIIKCKYICPLYTHHITHTTPPTTNRRTFSWLKFNLKFYFRIYRGFYVYMCIYTYIYTFIYIHVQASFSLSGKYYKHFYVLMIRLGHNIDKPLRKY